MTVSIGGGPAHRLREEIEVSFLITSYNKCDYLPGVLESVRREAEECKAEILLVDDGSTDGSDKICEEFAKSFANVRFFNQANRGIFATVNAIALKAGGAWIRFCDSDDPLIPGSTKRLIEAAVQNGAGVAYGNAVDYGPRPLPMDRLGERLHGGSSTTLHDDALMYLIRGMNFYPSSAVYARRVLPSALPLPANMISCQDLALLFPIARKHKIVHLDEPVCFHLGSVKNQLSANYCLTIQQTIRITQLFESMLSPPHKRAALVKAANRTRRWLRRSSPEQNSLRVQAWLLTINLLAKLGLLNFGQTLDHIAKYYEHELQPILEGHERPY